MCVMHVAVALRLLDHTTPVWRELGISAAFFFFGFFGIRNHD